MDVLRLNDGEKDKIIDRLTSPDSKLSSSVKSKVGFVGVVDKLRKMSHDDFIESLSTGKIFLSNEAAKMFIEKFCDRYGATEKSRFFLSDGEKFYNGLLSNENVTPQFKEFLKQLGGGDGDCKKFMDAVRFCVDNPQRQINLAKATVSLMKNIQPSSKQH